MLEGLASSKSVELIVETGANAVSLSFEAITWRSREQLDREALDPWRKEGEEV